MIAITLFAAAAIAQTKTTWSGIDDYQTCSNGNLAGCWQSSSSLAGGQTTTSISGPTVILSPSKDGASAQFTVGNNSGYADGMWWANTICCQLDISAGYSNFTYDLYFYITDNTVPQALEFDVNQTMQNTNSSGGPTGSSTRYVFGTQCNNVNQGYWQIWDEGVGWQDTGVRCKLPTLRWNHVVWQFQRTSDGQVYFVSLTFNGTKHYINRKYGPRALNVQADDLNAVFQMDTNASGTGYSAWLDKVTLTAW